MKKLSVFFFILLTIFALPFSAHAEMEKNAVMNEKGVLTLYWWPALSPPAGWHHDEDSSHHYSFNALAPDGFTFSDAETVMYVDAPYKPRVPESKTLEEFIQNDLKSFSDASVVKSESLTTADGQKIRTFLFSPQKEGVWERVGYGEEKALGYGTEEDEYFLVFTLSSHSRAGIEKAMKAYEQLVTSYKSKL
ncbi:MAG: hypothetical protein SFW62_02605 [Alphaproteobacteria bacterium]|nr:hypothetical protein [Alphaproteobacteria bacterium]